MGKFVLLLKNQQLEENRDAFTLMELMIVIAIIGILSAVAVPNFIDLFARTHLKKASWSLVSDIETAKISAVGDNSKWAVQFDTSNALYRVLSNQGPDGKWNTGDDTIFKTVKLSDMGVVYGSGHGKRTGAVSNQFDGVSFNYNRVIFNPDGTSMMGTVYVKNRKGDTIAVGSVSFDGRVKVWSNYGSGWERIK